MEVKLIEVRDAGTFVPMMAIRLATEDMAERYLLRRAGYGATQVDAPADGDCYILLVNLVGGQVSATYDPHGWKMTARTFQVTHQHLIDHWSEVASGDVVDVEHLLGLRPDKKVSERVTTAGGY